MPLLTKPDIIRKGEENNFLLDQSELLSVPKVANNAHYSNTNRWRFIVIQYKSSPNGNIEKVVFNPKDDFTVDPQADPQVEGLFSPSGFAENDFNVELVSIFGFDNSSLDIYREDLTTQQLSELDVTLTDSYGFYSYDYSSREFGSQELGGNTITGNLSISMWYKNNASVAGSARSHLISLDYGNPSAYVDLYMSATGDLYLAVKKSANTQTELVNGVNLLDGQWHSIVLAFAGTNSFAECTVFIDGVKEQDILGVDVNPANNIFIGNPTAADSTPDNYGPKGQIAQVEVWENYFDTPQAEQYHNSGSVLNPNLHAFANELIRDWTFGDNFSDDGKLVFDNKGVFDLTVLEAGQPAPFQSGSSEPNWNTEITTGGSGNLPADYNEDALVTDGEIIWESFEDDGSAPPLWNPNNVYEIGDTIQPNSANGYLFRMTDNARIVLDQP